MFPTIILKGSFHVSKWKRVLIDTHSQWCPCKQALQGGAPICSLCQFPWQQHAQFQAPNVLSLNTGVVRSQLQRITVVPLCVIKQIKTMMPLGRGKWGVKNEKGGFHFVLTNCLQ